MTHRLVVPFELPDPQSLSPVLVEALASLDIVVVGHYGLPEQTPPAVAREQFEDEAREQLAAVSAPFEEAGAAVTTRLVFGRNRGKAIDQIAIEEDCEGELDPAPTDRIDHVLVPIPDTDNVDRLASFVTMLAEGHRPSVTLLHVAEGDRTEADAEATVEAGRERMVEHGIDPDAVDTRIVADEDHDAVILDAASEYDAVVMGEATPTVADRIFGTLADKIVNGAGKPVVLVRRNHAEGNEDSA
jgi:nucleotide-binding universal stress UspA family protein